MINYHTIQIVKSHLILDLKVPEFATVKQSIQSIFIDSFRLNETGPSQFNTSFQHRRATPF